MGTGDMGYWRLVADAAIATALLELPDGAEESAVRQAISKAYPFGERKYHPYKVWLERVKVWMGFWQEGQWQSLAKGTKRMADARAHQLEKERQRKAENVAKGIR